MMFYDPWAFLDGILKVGALSQTKLSSVFATQAVDIEVFQLKNWNSDRVCQMIPNIFIYQILFSQLKPTANMVFRYLPLLSFTGIVYQE